jgi:exonuclease III
MKLMSLNLRGWGDTAKRRRVSSLIKSEAFDMCMFQETKKSSFDNSMIHNLWGHQDVEWVMKEASGMSGGLLTVWNKDLFSFNFSFAGTGYLGVCVEWKSLLVYIVNVYSPCSMAGKRKLWEDLLHFKLNNVQGEWCLGGDFNAILKVGERRGSSSGGGNQAERMEFNQFIDAMELIDIPISGKKFSWFSSDDTSMSRLDRFLLSEGFIEKGGITNQWIAARDISDHCPIWLVSNNLDWGPKPFRFNNCWLEHPAFIPFVSEFWEKTVIRGK